MSAKKTDTVRKRLESLLGDLPAPPLNSSALTAERVSDPMDDLQQKQDLDLQVSSLSAVQTRRRELLAALDRLAEGDYGRCEECDEAIAAKRLEAAPWARLCISCQEAAEDWPQAA